MEYNVSELKFGIQWPEFLLLCLLLCDVPHRGDAIKGAGIGGRCGAGTS